MKLKAFSLRFLLAMMLVSGIALLQTSNVWAAVCVSQSGNGDSDVITGATGVPAGTHISVQMTAAPGAGTAIAIIVGGNLEIADVVFTTPHVVEHTTSGSGDVTVVLDWEFNGNPANTYSLTIGCEEESGEGGPGPLATNLLDGRINNDQSKDVAAPVAIYLGSIEVYGIDPDTSEGNLSLYISDEQVEAVGVPSDAPVLLGEGTNTSTGIPISVYRLPTGEFLLMTHYATGTPYNFVWDDDGNRYHIPR